MKKDEIAIKDIKEQSPELTIQEQKAVKGGIIGDTDIIEL